MKWLFLLAVFILSQHPAEAPKDKRTTEANRAKSTAHAKNAESNQIPSAQPTPAPAQAPVATESQRSAATANDHTRTSTQQTSDEGRSTQRKLTWFTGVLAAVGVLQLVVMFLTWLIYRRQAREMRRQRHEMVRQRTELSGQRAAMENKLEAMKGQLIEKGEQTKVLKDSVAHAGTSAESALRSAKLQEAQLRQWLDIEDFDLQSTPIQSNSVETTLTISFQVNNPTKMVLTLKDITTNLFDEGPESSTLEYTLAPDNACPFKMEITISGESFLKYTKDVFVIPIA